jgi:hypothetical protein
VYDRVSVTRCELTHVMKGVLEKPYSDSLVSFKHRSVICKRMKSHQVDDR